MRQRGLVVAGGQGKWTGKILRVGHMGDVAWPEIDATLAVMAEALVEVGRTSDGAAARESARAAYEAASGAGVPA